MKTDQSWASNWRIDKKPGVTDSDGWEYASKMSRFTDLSNNVDRKAKSAKLVPKNCHRIHHSDVRLNCFTIIVE